MKMRRLEPLFSVICALALQGCVYVPATKDAYNADCHVASKHMELQQVMNPVLKSRASPELNGSWAWIPAAAAIGVASVIVSGSIVLAGNTAYWFENKSQCNHDK